MSKTKFNFNLKSVPTEVIGDTEGIFVEIPVYNDLLAQEYQEIEKVDRTEQQWNQKLLNFADELAKQSGLNSWEVVEKLLNLDSLTLEEQAKLTGALNPKLVQLQVEQPSTQSRLINYALIILQSRVDPNIKAEDVAQLPNRLLKEINDFIAKEQFDGKHQSYEQLKNNYDVLLGKAALGEQLILEYENYVGMSDAVFVEPEAVENLEKAKTVYWEYEDQTKKLGY